MLFAVCILLFLSSVTSGKKKECEPDLKNQEVRLKKELIDKQDEGYLSSPINNFNEKINVNVYFSSSRIQYFDGDGIGDVDYIVMDLHYVKTWNVSCLKWDPSKYGNLMKLHINEYDIWTPQFSAEEEFSDMTYNFNYELNKRCTVYSDGRVGCAYWHYFMLLCRENNKRLWPYDSNSCVLNLASEPDGKQTINWEITTDDSFKETSCSGDWTVKSIKTTAYYPVQDVLTVKPKNNNTGLKIEMALKRHSGTIAAYIVCPLLVISVLTLTALCLHIYNFTKVYLAVVSLGFHIVVNVIISEELPVNFSDPPLLVTFVRDSLAFTCVVLLSSLLTHYLFHRVDTPSGCAVAITNLCFYTRASILVFYNASAPNNDPRLENKGESSNDKIVAEINNNIVWVRLACIINSVVIVAIGFGYIVYMCMLVQLPVEMNK